MSRRGIAAGVVAGLGAAVTTGVLVDRRIGKRLEAAAREGDVDNLGSLRGEVHRIRTSDGLDLHAEVDPRSPHVGEGTEEYGEDDLTVVFVHGFALSLDCWHFQRAAFRGRHRLVFYDQRSHGRSDRSEKENATIDQCGDDLMRVLDELAPGPVVLVGHSMGGMTIVALAEEHPELFGTRVVGVGLVSTTAGGMRAHKVVIKYLPDRVGTTLVKQGVMLAAQRDRLLELLRRRGSAVGLKLTDVFAFGDHPVPPAYVAFVDDMISATPMSVLLEFIPQFDLLDKFHVVRAFERVPTWILGGTADKLTSIGHARKLHAHIDGSHLVVLEGGGHMPILEFKDEVNAALDDLLEAAEQHRAGGGQPERARGAS
ncbi:alpha/beta hydrolase [Nocardioides sp. HDW12B]|uniref:alpha/beta fold hydrolase n=1 Tax=Nocardioides sp. HDW12B TaxID=2714939 RepID=UPI0014099CB3|nr:alpha/beta hydrolase [Nocardioides sp. HDW12B]QIK65434.1 alpha/beta hydrolase [Nocardioides sp. HDW12B]